MADPTVTEIAGGLSTTATKVVEFAPQPAGRLLVLSVASDDYTALSGAGRPESTGWTLIPGPLEGNAGVYMWWKYAAAGEASVQYTIRSATGSAYAVQALTDVDTAFGVGVTASSMSGVAAVRGNHTTPAVTPPAGSRWVVVAAVASTGNVTAGPYTWTAPYVEVSERYNTAGYRPGITVATHVLDGGTATSATATFATSTSDQSFGIIAAFKAAPAASGTTAQGSPSTTAATATGAAASKVTGAGAPSAAPVTATGAGTSRTTAAGTPSTTPATATGAATAGTTAQGSAATTPATSTGAVVSRAAAAGAPTANPATATGAGVSRTTAQGAVTTTPATASGSTDTPPTLAQGTATTTPATAAGAATSRTTAQGSPSTTPIAATGAAVSRATGAGSPSTSPANASGAAVLRDVGSGTVTTTPVTATGAVAVRVTAACAVTIVPVTVSGEAVTGPPPQHPRIEAHIDGEWEHVDVLGYSPDGITVVPVEIV